MGFNRISTNEQVAPIGFANPVLLARFNFLLDSKGFYRGNRTKIIFCFASFIIVRNKELYFSFQKVQLYIRQKSFSM